MFSKKIVAGAALMALAAVAQAQVKVYGSLDMAFGSYKPVGGDSVTKVESGNMMTSFIGFSGSEDLGGGLKAEFALESFLGGDTGRTLPNMASSAGFWGRASWVGLSGSFGKFIIGQYDNALFVSGLSYNPFGSSMTFSPTMRHFYALGSSGTDSGAALAFDTGWVNSLTYETPNLNGFTASLQWAAKESSTDGAKDSFTLSAAYNAGPLSLMGVYVSAGATDANAAYLAEQDIFSLNASYDFGVAKGFFQYTDIDNESFVDGTHFQVGASVPMSDKGSILVSYAEMKYSDADYKDKIFSLGYDYYISKRTDVYVALSNEKATGAKGATSFAVGIKHAF